MKRPFIYLAIAAGLSGIALAGAYAAQSTGNDALAVAGAAVGLGQAITTAEQHVGGKATRAEYERHKGVLTAEIEVVKGKTVMDVVVDATSGKVLSAAEDKEDHNEHGAKHDKDD